MAGKKLTYDIFLEATSRGIERGMARGGDAAKKMSRNISSSVREANQAMGRMIATAGKVGLAFGAAGAAAGVYAFIKAMQSAVGQARALQQANFNMVSSVEAANRQFEIGSVESWNDTIRELSASLKIYSETDLKAAVSRTVDMTKRLGLSEEQMRNVIATAADLSAGKFELVDGIERVTAALRGEAEASEALGLTLNETYVRGWYEANNATGKAWKDMTDLEKAQVRYNILLEQAAPLLGKAAASYAEYDGALTSTKSAYAELGAAIGGIITQNQFVVEVLHLAEGAFDELTGRVNANRDQVMQYVKDGALAMIEFGQAVVTVAGLAVSAGNGIQGVFRTAAAASLLLSAGIFQVIYGIATLTDKLKMTRGAADEWRINAEAAFAASGKVFADAKQDFTDMAAGSESLGQASVQLDKLKKSLEQIDAGEVKEAADQAEEAATQIRNIGGTWVQVSTAAMQGATREVEYAAKAMTGNAEDLGTDWGRVWNAMERESLDSVDAIDRRLDQLTSKKREVTVYITEVTKKALGGLIQGYASGGRLAGYGGGDRIPALLEAGEFIIRKEAVRRFGAGMFAALNSLRLPGFASGGPVGAMGGGSTYQLNLQLYPDMPAVNVPTTRDAYSEIMRQQAERRRFSST